MKKLVICMALLSSASAFAGPIEDGTLLLIKGKAQVAKNKLEIIMAKNSIKDLASDLRSIEVKNEKLKKVYNDCSIEFNEYSQESLTKMEATYVSSLSNEISRTYNDLKISVAALESAKNCSDCDSEIKDATIRKYQHRITMGLRDLEQTSRDSVPADNVQRLSALNFCNFSGFFKYEDSKKFADLKGHNFGSYSTTLSPSEILSGEYNDTINLIVRKSPTTVKRSAALTGRESSSYKNGVVSMKLVYDDSFITGVDNVVHPEVQNAVRVIHRDR